MYYFVSSSFRQRLVLDSETENVNIRVIATLVVVAHLEEGPVSGEVLLQGLHRAAVESELKVSVLEAHLIVEAGSGGNVADLVEVLTLTASSHVLDADSNVTVAVVVYLGLRLLAIPSVWQHLALSTYKRLVVGVGLEDLANADAAAAGNKKIGGKTVLGRGGAPSVVFAKLGAAAGCAREGGALATAGGFHDHSAITRFGEEVLVAGVLVAVAALKLRGRDLVRLVGAATGKLQEELAEVKVATRSAAGVQSGCSGEPKGKGKKGLVGLESEHSDGVGEL